MCVLNSKRIRGSLFALEDVFSECFDYCHYLIPNSTTEELMSNLTQKLKSFNLNDYCLLFISELDIKENNDYGKVIRSIRESLQVVTHTNIIICSPTYIAGAPMYNFKVDMFNNLLYQSIQKYKYAYFYDSNHNLSHEMLSYTTGKINSYGIRCIYK
ncbi:unnamed protein product [Spodoptera littoralis]|uniref:Uncharacterized protein n=1 Tax=Spodoptera littoralis TaxID=7109 RepID=A0A9P0IFJ8_SPOLI|nr:unnamed protein product [Spodoptera littoralis]CAH1646890.1 unnamed protein product [Spodoptera littoralis]